MKVVLEKGAEEVILQDALETFPNECCGFMYGNDKSDTRIITEAIRVINNKEGDQRRRFEISPADYMKAERYAVQKGLTLLGVYHSHPKHPAKPSEHDLAKAMPFFSYIIVSVFDDSIEDLTSWQLNDQGEFEEELVESTIFVKNLD